MQRQILAAALCIAAGTAGATPVTVQTPFFNLENRGPNSLGINTSPLVRFGANVVLPNGSAGTTGVAVRDSDNLTRSLNFAPFPLGPNWFERYLLDNPAFRGAWTLTFTNGTDSTSVPIYLDPAAQAAKLVQSITISGSGETPTFTWTPQPGEVVNAYRVNLFEKTAGGNSGNIVSRNLPASQTSYTVDPAHFTLPNYKFKNDGSATYVIEISAIRTKDHTGNANNSNIEAIARAYADFTPTQTGGPIVNLPVLLPNGSYLFNMAVVPGQVYYIDPDVAVGYDYAIGDGNPNFASVDLPDNIGDGLYDILGFDAAGNLMMLADDWDGRDTFTFATGGLSRFRVTGIETSARLDPNSTTAFITGLTFTGAGQFTGTQTPITVFVDDNRVPEPSALALAGLGLLGLLRRWRAC